MGCLLWLCFLLLFHLYFLATCSSSLTHLCPHDQSLALLQFKNSFSINSSASFSPYDDESACYPKTQSWSDSTNCCSWDGVKCDSLTGHVIGLDLSCSWLNGTISPNSSLFHLPHLKSINLAFNHFRNSKISSQFGWFASLTHLNLTSSAFSGQVPSEISHLWRLILLDLSDNVELRIETPILKAIIQNLTEVRELLLFGIDMSSVALGSWMNLSSSFTSLSLSDCNLQGNFPINIFNSNLSQLETVSISGNSLVGSIPYQVGGLPNLSMLDLADNLLNGTIPSWLYTLPSLQEIDLSHNKLTGHINEFLSRSLIDINFANNKLDGPLPISIFELVNLTYLSLNSNNLSGKVELDMFSKLKNLQALDLSSNNLSLVSINIHVNHTLPYLWSLALSSCNIIEFPYFLQGSKNLFSLDLSKNKIQGKIPKWMWDVGKDSLSMLDLSNNLLTGIEKLPWKNLFTLDLHSNFLQGPLPIPPLTTGFFSIAKNSLTGELSTLICNLSSLDILDISHNNLSGIIPPCLGNLSKSLSVLDLQKNTFQGTIPAKFSKSCRLNHLNLNGNQLGGPVPRSMVNCRNLEVVDLGNNEINDTFPYWLGNLPELQVLVLRSNKFHGHVHGSRNNHSFSNLRIFDLSNNDFVGPLPIRYIQRFKAMINVREDKSPRQYMGEATNSSQFFYDFSVSITMKRHEYELVKILTILTSIDLSKNKLEGEIPKAIGELSSLKGLNLSHNNLEGPIPPMMGNLTNLEWLDLSSNKLVGEIPRQLADLTSLSVLDLSHNQLVGPIPHGKQFNTFNNDSYEGNLGLCGFPLTKTCSNVEPQPSPQSIFPEEDDSESAYKFGWKVVLMGYGCGMVFGLAVGYLVFKTRKPKWFVMLVEGGQHQKAKKSKKNAHRSGGRRN